VGFLDHNWWHRTYWQVGTSMGSGWGGWHKEAHKAPVGRLLVIDGSRVFGYGRSNYDNSGAHVGVDGRLSWGPVKSPFTFYRLFRRSLDSKSKKGDWSTRTPVLGQALVFAGDTLFMAGPEDPAKDIPQDPLEVDGIVEAIESDRGGKLLALSPADGKTLRAYALESPPVFDGMIAADGRIYMSTADGAVLCLGGRE
jgi:outer membrane protein assembly factor BamB